MLASMRHSVKGVIFGEDWHWVAVCKVPGTSCTEPLCVFRYGWDLDQAGH